MNKKHSLQPVEANPNFIQIENQLLKHWYGDGIVTKYLKKNNKSVNKFSFLDGPITANNPMGVHHGWGRTNKDFFQRYKNLQGFKQRFQNGFDCQGLWVEVEVEKELGFRSKKDIEDYGVEKFVQQCKDRVMKFSAIQTQQSQRLGYFMDWDHSYYTMSDENNYMIWHFLKVCHQNGWIYKGNDSVPWCPRCQTAISQHEMLTEDYKEVVHDSIYLQLPLVGKPHYYLIIWTTTPWTLPANIAVAVDPKLEYSLVEDNSGDFFWVARELVPTVFKDGYRKIVKSVPGSDLVGLKYTGPFDHLPAVASVKKANPKTFHTVVATDPLILPVTTSEGTGLVHTAVSAGVEDFKLGQKLGLPMIPVIADDASYLQGFDFLSGKNAKKHPELILNHLQERDSQKGENWVFKIEKYKHRYPACWRCKAELVWKVNPEWYIAMDKPGLASSNKKTLRQRMKAVAQKIHWLPEFGLERELDWLTNMHDWLISKKNRYWGLALPIYECTKCSHFEVIGGLEELQTRAVEGYDQFVGHSPHKPFIDLVKVKCSNCGQVVSRVNDVGNVWLDAGIVPFSTYVDPKTKKLSYTTDKSYWRQWFPIDFITESFPGQFKNWFYSMIAMSTVLEDTNPFQTVLGYASVLAEDGRPMHKSWGNSIDFNEAAEKIGVDVMRWLYLRQNPVNNLLFGYKGAEEVRRRFLLILWNSYRFFVNSAAADRWQPQTQLPPSNNLLDQWILSRFHTTLKSTQASLDVYDSYHATITLETFVEDLSTWYIRRSRDRVGPSATDTTDRHCAYQTMHYLFSNLCIVLSAFIPFITDTMYTNLTSAVSVHLSSWPKLDDQKINTILENQMSLVRQIVEKVHAIRQQSGIKTRQPLSSMTVALATDTPLEGNSQLTDLLKDEVNVKNVNFNYQKLASNKTYIEVTLDTNITPELEAEGRARELIRQVQQQRKTQNIGLDQKIITTLPDWPEAFTDYIKQKTLSTKLEKGNSLSIKII